MIRAARQRSACGFRSSDLEEARLVLTDALIRDALRPAKLRSKERG